MFQPLVNIPLSASFVPRRARFYTAEEVAAQGMPQQAYYGMESMVAQNYQLIGQMRRNTNQYEQNTQSIKEQMYNLHLWNQKQ